MIDRLPEKALPKWLADVDVGNQSSPFPLMDVLNDSLYYPSSRFDGSPIRHLSGNIHSFIYADYGVTSDELEEEVKTPGFLGYHKILSRSVTEKELTPNGWQPPPLVSPNVSPKMVSRFLSEPDGNPHALNFSVRFNMRFRKKPFATWFVFQRDDLRNNEHGAKRFSLLYLCAEGVTTYQALYVSNNCSALGIALIVDGSGFGGNWASYYPRNSPLATTVLNNPAGRPRFLFHDGSVRWPEYPEDPNFPGGGIWSKRSLVFLARDHGKISSDYGKDGYLLPQW